MEDGDLDPVPPSGQLDLERLAEISSGEIEFEREIIAEYMEQAWGLFEEATRALEAKDAAALRRIAHTLKGSSRTIGADGVALAAATLEEAAAESTQGTAAVLGRAFACLTATERAFERYFREGRGREAA